MTPPNHSELSQPRHAHNPRNFRTVTVRLDTLEQLPNLMDTAKHLYYNPPQGERIRLRNPGDRLRNLFRRSQPS